MKKITVGALVIAAVCVMAYSQHVDLRNSYYFGPEITLEHYYHSDGWSGGTEQFSGYWMIYLHCWKGKSVCLECIQDDEPNAATVAKDHWHNWKSKL